MTTFAIKAPLDGFIFPLEQVPDPVFSQKMVGDGISIDPTGQLLCAPCDGLILQVHRAGHAVTLTTAAGLELMIHIGLDTVQLKGEGFTPKVAQGQAVKTGDPLIEFDADLLATQAKSLLTQIVVTNSEMVTRFLPESGFVRGGTDLLLTLELSEPESGQETDSLDGNSITSGAIVIPNATGLHARPAAVLANLAKKYKSRVVLIRGEDQANAKSVVGIMGLEILCQDSVQICAEGPDAQQAIDDIVPQLNAGLGDEDIRPAPVTTAIIHEEAEAALPRSSDPNLLLGVPASPGLGIGRVFQIGQREIRVEETGETPDKERSRLDEALEQARVQLEALQAELQERAEPARAAIFAAHQALLDDPDLAEIADDCMARGKSAGFAWREAFTTHAERLAKLKNEVIAARAADLRDVGLRVLAIISGEDPQTLDIPAGSILVAEELSPSDTARLDPSRVQGFCTVGGGATSHVAILAQALNIPAVAGIEPRVLELDNTSMVVLDGSKGHLRINPDGAEIQRIESLREKLAVKQQADLAAAHLPSVTSDGHSVEVVANIGSVEEARRSVELGGEGVGLLRSEFLYLDRATAPGEDEQTEIYCKISEALDGHPMVIRTLDVGGDKPLAYLPMPHEDNPFLGVRGIRVGLERPELLRTQLRAILRASNGHKLRVMFPMVSTMDEIRAAKAILEEERIAIEGSGELETGIMVETPSAALMASRFAAEVDFFSIGSNDLTQYTMAMDRGHPKLAPFADAMNPAVLKLIAETVNGAHAHGKWVGVCGGIASDPQAIAILIGIGVDELSVSVPSIPAVKAEIRTRSLAECKVLAEQAMEKENAAAVRELVTLKNLTSE